MNTSVHDSNEKGGKHMTNSKDKQEASQRRMDAERGELEQAAERFLRSMLRTGVSLAFLPVNKLPPKPRQHFQSAGREFTHGLATLVRELADGLEGMAEDVNTATNFAEDPHTNEELE
jgi:hypothetical protein